MVTTRCPLKVHLLNWYAPILYLHIPILINNQGKEKPSDFVVIACQLVFECSFIPFQHFSPIHVHVLGYPIQHLHSKYVSRLGSSLVMMFLLPTLNEHKSIVIEIVDNTLFLSMKRAKGLLGTSLK